MIDLCDMARYAAHLREIAADLERIASGVGPSRAELAAAPVLSAWSTIEVPSRAMALTGVVRGHPELADGHTALTSRVVAHDPRDRWSRSWNRFYVLGAHEDELMRGGHA